MVGMKELAWAGRTSCKGEFYGLLVSYDSDTSDAENITIKAECPDSDNDAASKKTK